MRPQLFKRRFGVSIARNFYTGKSRPWQEKPGDNCSKFKDQ
jgi:hypothetical protein